MSFFMSLFRKDFLDSGIYAHKCIRKHANIHALHDIYTICPYPLADSDN